MTGEGQTRLGDPIQTACDECLRRGQLLGRAAEPLSRKVDSRAGGEIPALRNDELVAVAGLNGPAAAAFDPASIRAGLTAAGVGSVCPHGRLYPPGLRELRDKPAALYFVGRSDLIAHLAAGAPAVALVGSRRASPYGLEVAHTLGRDLGAAGVPVVSGMALGIDAAVHRGALEGSGPALAVLAGGPDVTYPRTHARLHQQLRARGVVLSELPPGVTARRWAFPARNRIMAGLARMTVVVEAAKPSGTLITAERALGLGREVGAVPGRVTARVAAGANQLLREGASLVRGADDVLDEVYGPGMGPAGVRRADVARNEADRLDPCARAVLEAVEAGLDADAICVRTGRPPPAVRAALAELELAGILKRNLLGAYERAAS